MALELTWLGQGGFLIRMGGAVICLDPYLSDNCERHGGHTRIAPPPMDPAHLDADLVVITHDHMDHLDELTIRRMDTSACLFAAPKSCREHLIALGVPEESMLLLDRGDQLGIGDCELNAIHAEHTEDSIGLIISGGGRTVYFTGDTLYTPELARQATPFRPGLLVTCINGRWGNMDEKQAAQVAAELNVKLSIPCHYGMFAENTADPQDFIRAMGDRPVQLLEMNQPTKIDWNK